MDKTVVSDINFFLTTKDLLGLREGHGKSHLMGPKMGDFGSKFGPSALVEEYADT